MVARYIFGRALPICPPIGPIRAYGGHTTVRGAPMPNMPIPAPAPAGAVSRLDLGADAARGSEPSQVPTTCPIVFCFEASDS